MNMVSVKIRDSYSINISPGKHSELIRSIIEDMAPRFLPESELVYIGDTGEKWGYYNQELAGNLLFNVQQHGKMPDVILYAESKNWLVLVESATSHGPVDSKRYIELEELFFFCNCRQNLYFSISRQKNIHSFCNRYCMGNGNLDCRQSFAHDSLQWRQILRTKKIKIFKKNTRSRYD